MGERAEDLARRLEQSTEAVRAAIESRRADEDDNRVLADHLATCHALVLSLAQAIINKEPLPSISWEMIHEINSQHVRANTTVDLSEALQLLRTTTVSTVEAIRQLTDEQIDSSAQWGLGAENLAVSARDLIETHIIGHAEEHLGSEAGARRL